jgi:hypothetical protein
LFLLVTKHFSFSKISLCKTTKILYCRLDNQKGHQNEEKKIGGFYLKKISMRSSLENKRTTWNFIWYQNIYSPINRKFYLAKGTEKFIPGRHPPPGILLISPSLRPAILDNRGAKSHPRDYFTIRARYLYLSYYRKCRACNSLHFLSFMPLRQINSLVATACRNREFPPFLHFPFFSTPPQR